jgi:hypothetical protein
MSITSPSRKNRTCATCSSCGTQMRATSPASGWLTIFIIVCYFENAILLLLQALLSSFQSAPAQSLLVVVFAAFRA